MNADIRNYRICDLQIRYIVPHCLSSAVHTYSTHERKIKRRGPDEIPLYADRKVYSLTCCQGCWRSIVHRRPENDSNTKTSWSAETKKWTEGLSPRPLCPINVVHCTRSAKFPTLRQKIPRYPSCPVPVCWPACLHACASIYLLPSSFRVLLSFFEDFCLHTSINFPSIIL